MGERTICLSPFRLTAGMCLASSVHRSDGVVLLSEGTRLEAGQIINLQQRGIDYVLITMQDDRDAATIEAERSAMQQQIDHLFRGPTNDTREELHRAVLNYRLGVIGS